jgi:hypothetical protein
MPSGGARLQNFITLQDEKQIASPKVLFHAEAKRRPRTELKRPSQVFEGSFSRSRAETSDVVYGEVLEVPSGTAIIEDVAERNVLRPIQRFKHSIG